MLFSSMKTFIRPFASATSSLSFRVPGQQKPSNSIPVSHEILKKISIKDSSTGSPIDLLQLTTTTTKRKGPETEETKDDPIATLRGFSDLFVDDAELVKIYQSPPLKEARKARLDAFHKAVHDLLEGSGGNEQDNAEQEQSSKGEDASSSTDSSDASATTANSRDIFSTTKPIELVNPLVPWPAREPHHTVEWFLKSLKRECDLYCEKFTSWDHMFTATEKEMEDMGIPIRVCRRIIRWTERYRQGFDPFFEPPSRKLILKTHNDAKKGK